jgi:hypothetical protein
MVDPFDDAFLLLQSDDENVYIVLPSKYVFVRIDEIVRERVADFIEGVAVVGASAKQIVEAVQTAKEGEGGLGLKVNLLHINDHYNGHQVTLYTYQLRE